MCVLYRLSLALLDDDREKERKKEKEKKKKSREKTCVSLPVVCFVQKIYRLLVASYAVSGASGESRVSHLPPTTCVMCACILLARLDSDVRVLVARVRWL